MLFTSFFTLAGVLGLSASAVATPVEASTNANANASHDQHQQHHYRKSFHCYRPFDSLPSFSLSAMKASDNCRLDYQQVLDAAVRVDCYRNGARYATAVSGGGGAGDGAASLADRFGPLPSPRGVPFSNGGSDRADVVAGLPADDRSGCYATMMVKMARDGGFNGRGYVINDDARYGVKLHTSGGGVVHYKGMDGIGYSVCCMFLNQPQHSRCEWQNVTTGLRHTETTAETGAAGLGAEEKDGGGGAGPHRLEQIPQYCNIEAPTEGEGEKAEDSEDPLGIMGDTDDKDNDANNNNKKPLNGPPSVVGYVTKPLHKGIAGTWTMETLFYRGSHAVGKVVVDFNVTASMISGEGHHHDAYDPHAAAAAAKEAAAAAKASANKEGDAKAHEHAHAAAAAVAVPNSANAAAAAAAVVLVDEPSPAGGSGNSRKSALDGTAAHVPHSVAEKKHRHHGRDHHNERHKHKDRHHGKHHHGDDKGGVDELGPQHAPRDAEEVDLAQ